MEARKVSGGKMRKVLFQVVRTDNDNDARLCLYFFFFFQEAEEEMKELEEYKDAKSLLDSVELEH